MPASSSSRKKRPASRDSRRHGLQPEEPARPKPGKKKRRKDPTWARLAVVFGALFMMVGGGSLVAVKVASAQLDTNITTTQMIDSGSQAFAGNDIDGAITLLMVGIDVAPSYNGPGSRGGGVLSDTIIIAHIPASHDQAYLMSVPRDTRVQIPAEPKYNYRGGTERVNAAFGIGYRNSGETDEVKKRAAGVDMLSKTINSLTGIKFNGAMLIDFDGFQGVLKEMGGVELCVDHRVRAIHLAYDAKGKVIPVWYQDPPGEIRGIPSGGRELWFEKGCKEYSAELALEYSRLRKGLPNGDYDRQKNQQKLIKAMVKKAMSKGVVTDIPKLNKVIEAGGKAMILDIGGAPLLDFVFTMKDVALNDLVMIRTNAGKINAAEVDGQYTGENLTPESLELFRAVKEERLQQFVLEHPEFLAPE